MALSFRRYMIPESDSKLIQYLKDRSKKERESLTGKSGIIFTDAKANRLDDDLIVEILSLLPVRWLLQYKSVCKAWHAIISSPAFASVHLKNYYKNKNDSDMRDLFLAHCGLDQYRFQTLVMAVDDTPKPRVIASGDMVNMPMYVSQICGPCDGLYYLYYYGYRYTQRALWNPAINELRVLPPLQIKSAPFRHLPESEVFGLAYDHVTADYKVVVITKYRNTLTDCVEPQSVAVYSLRKDCWKYCGDLRSVYDLEASKCYNFINGWYYWMEISCSKVRPLGYVAIIGFNVVTDECDEIKLPDLNIHEHWSIGIYYESLALLTFDIIDCFLKMWTLKDGIWVMKFQLGQLKEVWRPICHWKDNKFFMRGYWDRDRFALFDPESKDINELYQGWPSFDGVFLCGESLVSVKRDTETSESDLESGTPWLFCYEASETDSDYGIHDLFYSESSETDSEYGIDELFCHEV